MQRHPAARSAFLGDEHARMQALPLVNAVPVAAESLMRALGSEQFPAQFVGAAGPRGAFRRLANYAL